MKAILTLFTATVVWTSCTNSPPGNPSNVDEKLIRQYYEYFNQHNWPKMAGMYIEVADFKDPSLGPGVVKQTRQQTIDKYTALGEMFPDLKDSIVSIYPSGDKHIVVEFISTGTGADSVKFELPICTIFELENGMIAKDYTYYDNF